jgi:hypothetical protein
MWLTPRTVFLLFVFFSAMATPAGAADPPDGPMTVVVFHGNLESHAELLASRISNILETAPDDEVVVLSGPTSRGVRLSGADVENAKSLLVDSLLHSSEESPLNLFKAVVAHRKFFLRADVIVLVMGGERSGDDGNQELVSLMPQLVNWLEGQRKRVAAIILEGKPGAGGDKEAAPSDLRVHQVLARRYNRRFMAFVPPPAIMGGTDPAPELINEALCWAFPINLREAMGCEAVTTNLSVGVSFDPMLGLSTKRKRELLRRFTPTVLTGSRPGALSIQLETRDRSIERAEEELDPSTDFHFHVIASETGATYQRPMLRVQVGSYNSEKTRKLNVSKRILSGYEALIDWIELEIIGEIERQVNRLGQQRTRSFQLSLFDNNGVRIPDGITVVPESYFGGPGWERSDAVHTNTGGAQVKLPVDALYHRFLLVNDEGNEGSQVVAQLSASDLLENEHKRIELSGVSFREVEFNFSEAVEGNVDLVVFRQKVGGSGNEDLFFLGSSTRSNRVPLLESSYLYLAIPDDPIFESRLATVPAGRSEVTVVFEQDPLVERSEWRQAVQGSFSDGRLTADGLRYFKQSAHFISALIHATSEEHKENGNIDKTRAMWRIISKNASTGGEFTLVQIARGLRLAKFTRPGDTPYKTWHRFRLWLDVIGAPGTKRLKPSEQAMFRAWLKAVIERNDRRGLITPMFAGYLLLG